MKRDHQFEIQYLLTLTIAVVGLLRIPDENILIDQRFGYGLLFVAGIHVVLLTITYSLRTTTEVHFRISDSARKWSGLTMLLVTGSFVILLFHAVSSYTIFAFTSCSGEGSLYPIDPYLPFSCSAVTTLIAYVGPFLITGIMGFGIGEKIIGPYLALRKIDLFVAPDNIIVYSTFSATEALFIKAENTGDSPVEIEMVVQLPDNVVGRVNDRTIRSSFSQEVRIPPGGRDTKNLELRYEGDKIEPAKAKVEFNYENQAVKERDIEMRLDPA